MPGVGTLRGRLGLALGPALFLLVLVLPRPEGLSEAGWRTVALGLLMTTWWVTEPVPLALTALLPLPLAPLLGVATVEAAAAPFGNPVLFLFLGGFLIALGVERWRLHERIALLTARRVGTEGPAVVGGFMLATATLSMWISNSAAALLMLPMGRSVLDLLPEAGRDRALLGPAMMLGIAYAATLGGLGTLIGTPPNALLAGFAAAELGVEVGFARWMMVGVPVAAVGLVVTWWLLTRLFFPVRGVGLPGGRGLVDARLALLGPVSPAERRVGAVFVLTALLWVAAPFYGHFVRFGDAGVAVLGAVALFLVPSGTGRPLLVWDEARRLPWNVLLLFGGGLSLAVLIGSTGLAAWLGARLEAVGPWPVWLIVALVVLVVIFLSEVMSNTAVAATVLPVAAALALAVGIDPMALLVPTALAASCAFMLPVGTPPNAVAYATGAVDAAHMARVGLVLNLVFVVLITAHAFTLARWVL